MRSLRFRIAATAGAITAVALVLASWFLLSGLRGSLFDQLDESIADIAIDYVVNIESTESLIGIGTPTDLDTLLVVFDEAGDEPWLANDVGVRVDEILAEIDVRVADQMLDPLLGDASIESATDTTGATSLRVAVAPVLFSDLGPQDPAAYVLVGRSTEPITATVESTRNQLLVLVPLLVAFVGLLAWWLTGRALRPVEVLRSEVSEITSSDLRRRVTQSAAAAEIDRLAVTMNAMLERLDDGVRRQQRFVSDAAHELRTPLASVAAQLDVDAHHPTTADPALTRALVRSEVTRMQTLVESLLILARADQDRVGASIDRLLDLDELARQSVAAVPIPSHLQVDVSGLMPVEVRGDPGQLRRVLDNLVANAVRHARLQVTITTGSGAEGVWCAVDDDGSGIPEADRERVFDRFVRLDEARARDAGGSGLGLALARELVRAHGGDLRAEAAAIGGARLIAVFPVPTLAPTGGRRAASD